MNLSTFARLGALVAGGGVGASAFALPPDLATLTTAVDLSTAGTAVLAVGVTLVGLYVIIKGARLVIGMVKRG